MPNFIGIHTCFNVTCVLVGRNFDFLMVTWWLLLVTRWLLVATDRYRLLLLVPTFSMMLMLPLDVA